MPATPAIALPLTGFAVTLTLLSLGSGARDLYALTLLPALALLAVPALQNLRRGAANAWFWRIRCACAAGHRPAAA